jgi:bifunctional DNase/RNase
MKDLLGALDAKINSIHLTELKEGVFYSVIKLEGGRDVSARPSDAIALALRTGAPILGSEELLNEVGIEIPDESEDEVERFKEFLEGINPEDFQA